MWLFDWLTKQGAARATVILVFITAWYAFLTHRMAKAMNRQTRAMIQPVLSMDFDIEKEEFYPKGRFEVKNVGAQPVLILNMRLGCRIHDMALFDEYKFYERHILPPSEKMAFKFDFTERYQKKGATVWSPGFASFNLEVVTSDLGEEVILTYRYSAYWRILTVKKGMPLRVHWKFFSTPFKQWYYRILYKFNPPTVKFSDTETLKRKTRRWAWLKSKSSRHDSGPPET
jgi:hypothetical protein